MKQSRIMIRSLPEAMVVAKEMNITSQDERTGDYGSNAPGYPLILFSLICGSDVFIQRIVRKGRDIREGNVRGYNMYWRT